jgi:hypothetical protein
VTRRKTVRFTRAAGKAYLLRWRKVTEMNRALRAATSDEDRLRDLATLMASVRGMGWEHDLEEGDAEVRERWNRLRRAAVA